MTQPSGDATTVEVLGEQVQIPVEIRDARSWFASFLVPLNAARALVAPAGLEPTVTMRKFALATLAFVRYSDGDLGPYQEVAVAVLVEDPSGPGSSGDGARGAASVYIHQLPVNQEFTCAAGREIWGFPKFIADITITEGRRSDSCDLVHEGREVLRLEIGHGVPTPVRDTALDALSFCDGALRRTSWSLDGSGSRLRPSGASLELGDHPIADELRGLGLPHRALMSGSLRRVRMSFSAAEVLSPIVDPSGAEPQGVG